MASRSDTERATDIWPPSLTQGELQMYGLQVRHKESYRCRHTYIIKEQEFTRKSTQLPLKTIVGKFANNIIVTKISASSRKGNE